VTKIFFQFRYATRWDNFCLFIGLICAILSGVSQPVLALVSGRITNVLLVYPPTSKEFRNKAYENVYIFLGIGVFIFITNFIQFMCFHSCCTRIIAKMRHEYVRAILRQNAGWFDRNHSGMLATKLNDNMERIREGIGDKLGLLLRGCAMFIAAVIIAFIYEWRLAFMMLGVLNGLNLVIEPGQTVALVGHSGCGKSTSVGLLTRLYEPESGRVMLDGEDVRELNIEWLRNTIGIVQQVLLLDEATSALDAQSESVVQV
ncbi:unnamed protein product, partial [Strongylus vulgaris]